MRGEVMRSQEASFEDKMLRLLQQNNDLQEKNLIAARESRKAISDMNKILVDMNEKLRKITLNY